MAEAPALRRVVIGVGAAHLPARHGAQLGPAVVRRLLEHCGADPEAVHHPRQRGRTMRTAHTHAWATERFQDFGGAWCDCLLLGTPGVRSAVLEPHGTAADAGSSVGLVLQAHDALRPSDLLFVVADAALPRHTAHIRRLGQFDPPPAVAPAIAAVARFRGRPAAEDVALLRLGIEGAPLLDPQEWAAAEHTTVPRAAFGCALWASNPADAAALLNRPATEATDAGRALWRCPAAQRCLRSKRDQAILDAHRRQDRAGVGRLTKAYVDAEAAKIIDREMTVK